MGISKDFPNFCFLRLLYLSKLQTKIIMSAYVVRQWLFIDIETDDFGRIDFLLENLAASDAHIEALACVRISVMLCYATLTTCLFNDQLELRHECHAHLFFAVSA